MNTNIQLMIIGGNNLFQYYHEPDKLTNEIRFKYKIRIKYDGMLQTKNLQRNN